jgi:hypothetical protein
MPSIGPVAACTAEFISTLRMMFQSNSFEPNSDFGSEGANSILLIRFFTCRFLAALEYLGLDCPGSKRAD